MNETSKLRERDSDDNAAQSPTTVSSPQRKGTIFVPLFIPLRRRLQTLAVLLWLLVFPCCVISTISCASYFIYALTSVANRYQENASQEEQEQRSFWRSHLIINTVFILCAFSYLARMLTCRRYYSRGGGYWRGLMQSRCAREVWCKFCDYFPSKVVFDEGALEAFRLDHERRCRRRDKLGRTTADGTATSTKEKVANAHDKNGAECEGDEDGEVPNYLVACHPHGVFGFGVFTTFAASTSEFHSRVSEPFNLQHTIHTMTVNFRLPFWREYLLWMCFCDVSKESLEANLRSSSDGEDQERGTGRIAVIVPGGASESIDCTRSVLTLKNRKGFVKIALRTRAALVPCFTFGETQLYKPIVQASWLEQKLHRLQKLLGIGTPLVHGRGVFNYALGALPFRVPLRSVIGKPITIPPAMRDRINRAGGKILDSDVAELHDVYVAELTKLYERHKSAEGTDAPLQFR